MTGHDTPRRDPTDPADEEDEALYRPARHYTRDHDPHETGPEDTPRVRGPEEADRRAEPPSGHDTAGPSQ